MDKEKIYELCVRASERMKEALDKGDTQKALDLVPTLTREDRNMHKLLAQVIGQFLVAFIQTLGIGKARFFALLRHYRHNPEGFSLTRQRTAPAPRSLRPENWGSVHESKFFFTLPKREHIPSPQL